MDEYVIAKYLRLSLEDGDLDPNEKDESNSIKNQRKLIDGFIQARFAGKRIKVVEFVDDGKSGTNFNRPGITKLLELAKSGEINCIIVKDFSRWGRDYITVSDYLEQIFPFLQIRFISVNDDYDSENLQYGSAGMVDVGFKNIMHDLYSKELSQKLKLTKKQLFEAGKYHSSFAFYGYMKSPKEKYKLVIDNNTANVVRKLFKWVERGMKTTQIAKKLNDKKVPTPMAFLSKQSGFKWYLKDENHGKMWTSSAVLRILKDERYTGKSIYGRTKVVSVGSKRSVDVPKEQWIVVPDMHPVIIEQDRFNRVQLKLKKHCKKKNENSDRLFSGNIRCGHCGYAPTYHPAKYPYYQCHTHVLSDVPCYGNRVLEQELADIVLTAAKQMALVAIDALTEVDNKKSEAQIKASELKKKIRHMKSQEEKLLLKNNNLFEALMDEKIDNSEYTMKTVANNDLIQRCRADVATLEEELADIPTTKEEKNERKLLKRLLTIEKLDKALVDCLVRSVTIYLEGKIHIEWKFSYFCDIMKNKDGRTVDDVSKMEISNRVWLYYCSDEGWEKLNDIRQAVSECAEKLGLKVVGDSFDNAGLSLTANGFKEMQRAVRQGRVNAVIVPTMEGVSKTTEAYTSFERGIRKRKVRLYDMHGNLIIG